MSKILLIAAAVLLIGSSVLSFLNKGKMTAKSEEIVRVNGVASAAQADATKTHATLKTTEKSLGEANSKAADLDGKLTAANNDLAKLKDEQTAAENKLKENETEIARLNKAVADAANGPKPAPGPSTDADALAKANTERDELKTVNEGLQNRIKGVESQIAEFQKEKNMRIAGTLRPGLTGRILAVDRNWNFVVLSLGDRNGVNNNATMVVRRGESMVGRVKITSVEPSQSIADIVPNSVPPGVSVQAGDTVIFPGGS